MQIAEIRTECFLPGYLHFYLSTESLLLHHYNEVVLLQMFEGCLEFAFSNSL